MPRSATRAILGDPPPGRTPWSGGAPAPAPPASRDLFSREEERARLRAERDLQETLGATPPPPLDEARAVEQDEASPQLAEDVQPAVAREEMRPIAALVLPDAVPQPPPTEPPILEGMAPADLLIDARYQRDLSEKSLKLIRGIVEGWDWRRFKPPIVAWAERGFEVIDGQHTAIAAATHPDVARIPVMVVEAAELEQRASAFIGHNRDRLAVLPVQLHHAAVAAGDEHALAVQRVCAAAGVSVVRTQFGSRVYKVGDTMAVGAIQQLIAKRTEKDAEAVLRLLVQAGSAPITAKLMKGVDWLMSEPDYAGRFAPGELAKAIRGATDAERETKVWCAANCQPLWKGLAVTWFRKTRKKREGG